jgi:hypothetical protein
MLFVGVDPGKKGAIAMLDDAGAVVELLATPMIRREGEREKYNLAAIAEVFRSRCDRTKPGRGLFVTIEKLGPMPMRFAKKGGREDDDDANVSGTIANFNRGLSWIYPAMLEAFRIPYQLVVPQTWQRTILAGLPGKDPKPKSIALARKVWPNVDLRRTLRSEGPDDGKTDALHMAEFGRRTCAGGAMFAAAVARAATSSGSAPR